MVDNTNSMSERLVVEMLPEDGLTVESQKCIETFKSMLHIIWTKV
jgi:hypothetical protein